MLRRSPLPSNYIFFSLALMLCICLLSCKKYNEAPYQAGEIPTRPIAESGGMIIVKNNSPADIRISVNNVSNTYFTASGAVDTLYGSPSTAATVVIETVVTDPQGNPAGQQLVFIYSMKFPESRTSIVKEVNIPPTVFFLGIRNQSGVTANQLVVSQPGSNSTVSTRLPISCSQRETPCGYYLSGKMLADVKVIADSSTTRQWNFDGIVLPGTPNQRVSLTCN
jgi:hypothetical protein